MAVMDKVIIVDMQSLKAVSEGMYHIHRAVTGALHFSVTKIKTGNKKIIVHQVDMLSEILSRSTGGKG